MKICEHIRALLVAAALVSTPVSTPVSALAAPGSQEELRPFFIDGEGKAKHQTTIDLVGLSRCMFGDMDSLILALQSAEGALGMQLSVEAMGSATETYYGLALENKTSPDNMGSYQLTLPKTLSPKLYGVFLCTIDEARAGQSPCSAQALKTADQLAAPYRADMERTATGAPQIKPKLKQDSQPDKLWPTIFYAQFFVANKEGASILTNVNSPALAKTLSSFGFPKSNIPKLTEAIKRYNGTISSLPLDYVDGRLQMQMPYYNQEKCMGK